MSVHWRAALDINPDNAEAARNIEVARLTIKDIIDQINKQKQEQQEQQKQAAPDATAQEILDKEQEQKKKRQILQRRGWQKVEKDW